MEVKVSISISKDLKDNPVSIYSWSVFCELLARKAVDSLSVRSKPIFWKTSRTSCLLTPPAISLSTLTKTSPSLSVDYFESNLGSHAVSIAL